MSAKALQLAAAALGCLGLLLLAGGGALVVGGSLAGAKLPSLGGGGDRPTNEIIERDIRATYEKPGDGYAPHSTVEIHQIVIGDTYPANAQDIVEGAPPGGSVTAASVDWTLHEKFPNLIKHTRYNKELKVYIDKFGKWRLFTERSITPDNTTSEP